MLDQVHGEGGLAHRGTAGNDHQIRRLQAGGHVIEITEAGRQARHLALEIEQLIDAVHRAGQQLTHALGATALGPRLADLEHQALGLVDQLIGITALRAEGALGDLVGRLDELAQRGALANDVGIGLDVAGRGSIARQLGEGRQPADRLELVTTFQQLGQRHHIQRAAAADQLRHCVVDETMLIAIEVVGHQPLGDRIPGAVVQHQAAKHRLLGLQRIGRHLERCRLAILILNLAHAWLTPADD